MEERAFKLAKAWASDNYIDASDREIIQKHLEASENNEASKLEILESFYKDLEFGTGGLRAIIGIGSNRMNKYNVRRATQALSHWILSENSDSPRACISFDSRQFSKEFAMEAASVFAANGIKTYIFPELTPTPMLSYAIRHYQADGGIMLTASHNPRQYNGFKAYGSDGAQVTPPHDLKIISEYNAIESWNQIKTGDFQSFETKNMIEWISKECNDSFYTKILENSLNLESCKENGDKVHFIYTPLHGCGYPACKIISEKQGFTKFEVVESQAVPDGNFTTIESTPNPEDPVALKLAVALMKESNADVAYGTDPDCDRLGVVVNDKGIEKYLNGNQIAILMLHHILSESKKLNRLPENPLVIKSIVTSPMQDVLAGAYGADVLNTLTGFKWMARLWKDLLDQDTQYNYVFASEESFGYMPYDFVRDKDAVSSIALMNEIVLKNKLAGKNLIQALDDIYEEFGYFEESLIALTFEGIEGSEKIKRIMDYFRANQRSSIANFQPIHIEDYTLEHHEFKSNVLSFEFKTGDMLFLRPSGTEPKIKFYTMVRAVEGDLASKKKTASEKIKDIESFIHSKVAEI